MANYGHNTAALCCTLPKCIVQYSVEDKKTLKGDKRPEIKCCAARNQMLCAATKGSAKSHVGHKSVRRPK